MKIECEPELRDYEAMHAYHAAKWGEVAADKGVAHAVAEDEVKRLRWRRFHQTQTETILKIRGL